jgi:two-component system sensor histidine kinase KdpD
VNSKRLIVAARWFGAIACLAGIVVVYRMVHVNQTTVALTLLLLILFLAARWGLRYAIVISLAATACYNFFFLPPYNTFTVSDPQNLLALGVFLITSVVASRLSDRIRSESQDAQARQAELEVLYRLSRALLQTDELVQLSNTVPGAVEAATGAHSVVLYLLDSDSVYLSGLDWATPVGTAQLQDLSHGAAVTFSTAGQEAIVPLRTGVRPRGVLILRGVQLSTQTLEALGGLVSVSLDRAGAVAEVTRAEAAKESERLRGWMLDSITHELRTPLTSIKASVSTLLTASLPAESARELLTVIDEESDRLNRLVTEAVEMTQLDSQEVKMNLAPHALAPIIEASLEEYAAPLASHTVDVRLPASMPKVISDPVWIQKLVGNLLENAAKYSAAGTPIFVSAEMRGGFVACSVADRGFGIDPLEQSLIFDKFYRSRHRVAGSSGTGMGLAICRAIVDAHGGTIWVTSQLGQGSVFTFTLPVASR